MWDHVQAGLLAHTCLEFEAPRQRIFSPYPFLRLVPSLNQVPQAALHLPHNPPLAPRAGPARPGRAVGSEVAAAGGARAGSEGGGRAAGRRGAGGGARGRGGPAGRSVSRCAGGRAGRGGWVPGQPRATLTPPPSSGSARVAGRGACGARGGSAAPPGAGPGAPSRPGRRLWGRPGPVVVRGRHEWRGCDRRGRCSGPGELAMSGGGQTLAPAAFLGAGGGDPRPAPAPAPARRGGAGPLAAARLLRPGAGLRGRAPRGVWCRPPPEGSGCCLLLI